MGNLPPNFPRENETSKFPAFKPLDISVLNCKMTDMATFFEYYSPSLGLNWDDVNLSKTALADIADRVEKRRVYFHIYHEGLELGELNEVALQCFWILKLFPFCNSSDTRNVTNVLYAVFLFFRMICYVANKRGKRANITDVIAQQVCYAFMYRDISKESIMLIAESLIY